ncbi:MAG: AAA family ATPase [Gammaproteobacteria bacterium]
MLPERSVSRIADAEALAPAVIARAASVVHAIRRDLPSGEIAGAIEHLVDSTLKAQGHPSLKRDDANRLPEFYDPAFINTDADLVAIADGLRQTKSGRVCLYGPPGTGKTAFGRWLADRLGVSLHVRRASDLLSMWVGATEKNIARAFREAEQDGALFLLDEVDSFLQDRRGAQRSWEVTQVNEMLTQMENFPGVFIASTNLMEGLDQAAFRRFDLKVKFGYLRAEQAWALLERQCAALSMPAPDTALQPRVAKLAVLTPGDFAAVARQHRFRPIESAIAFVQALQAECAMKDGHRPRWVSCEVRWNTTTDELEETAWRGFPNPAFSFTASVRSGSGCTSIALTSRKNPLLRIFGSRSAIRSVRSRAGFTRRAS